jgi:hypothetical protein
MKYSELIADDIQAELLQMSERETNDAWRLGELANNIFYSASLAGASVTMNMVCSAVAHYRGCSASKVQQVARIEGMFPFQDRQPFLQLPFSHFEFASRFGDPIAVLQYSAANYPISVNKLEMVFGQHILAEQVEAMEGNGPPVSHNINFASTSAFDKTKPLQLRVLNGMVDALMGMIKSRFFEQFTGDKQTIIRDRLLTVISSLQEIRVALGEEIQDEEMPM